MKHNLSICNIAYHFTQRLQIAERQGILYGKQNLYDRT